MEPSRRAEIERGGTPATRVGADEVSPGSEVWRQVLLGKLLRVTAAVLFLGPVVATAVSGSFRTLFWLIEVAGAVCLLMTRAPPSARRRVAVAYLLGISGLILIVGASYSWSPAVVASLCHLSVAAGLLFGARAVLLVALATFGVLEIGGCLVLFGYLSIPLDRLTDPRIATNWARSSAIFLLVIGVSSWLLRSVLEDASRVAGEARDAIQAARERIQAATELRATRMAQELAMWSAQRLQMVAQLGEGFAHLFNNLLTVVRCGCEEVRSYSTTPTIRRVARDICEVARECGERTRELLIMSRSTEEPFAPVNVANALREGYTKLTSRLRTNVQCELATEPCGTVRMPPSWLEQMLTNLVLNAEQALPEDGQIRLGLATITLGEPLWSTIDQLPPARYAVLSVSDDGPGMPPEALQRACEPFFTTKSPARHAGLGLTLVHGMAKQLGGSLELRSSERGTRVSVFLPCCEEDESARPAIVDAPVECRRPEPIGATPVMGAKAAELQVERGAVEPVAPDASRQGPDDGARIAKPPPALRPAAGVRATKATGGEPSLNWTIGVVAGIVLLQAFNSFYVGNRLTAGGYVLSAILLAAITQFSRIAHGLRLWVLLSSILVLTLIAVVNSSLLAPSPILGMALPAFIAAVYGTRRTLVAALVGIASCLFCAAWFWTQTRYHGGLAEVTPDRAANWFRLGLALPIVLFAIAMAVLQVVSTAQAHAIALVRAHRELEWSHAVYQTETDALLRVEETRGRAARMAEGGLLTGVTAHDLNNSLGAMLGWAEMLEDSRDPDEIDEAVTTISRSADYAEALVHQLRHRVGDEHRGPSLDAAAALRRMEPMLRASSAAKRHRVSLRVHADEGCFVAISEHSLRRIALNLVTNARDACGDAEGICEIQLALETSTVILRVSDTGCGIDESTRRRIFEPFFTTKGQQGTGLGLHSVLGIVQATNGTVDVSSEPGVGTQVVVRWPLAPPSVAFAPLSVPPMRGTGKARILFAEDHRIVREVMARGLRRAGYTVLEAQDGDEALGHMGGDACFDVLCTDAVMPGEPVTQVVRRFSERFPGAPICVISGYLPEELVPQLRANPGVRILLKPVTQRQLIDVIDQLSQAVSDRAV